MSSVVPALRDFANRIAGLDLPSERQPTTTLRLSDGEVDETIELTPSALRALKHALEDYHDPRDCGECDHCGSRRIDGNFICLACGQPNGVFGQLLREHSQRYDGDPDAISGH